MKIGEYLKKCRIDAGLTQKDVANRMALQSAQYISNVERGACGPTLNTLDIWALYVGANKNTVVKTLMAEYRQKVREALYG